MLRYTILLTAILISVTSSTAADIGNSKVFYENYLPDGRVIKILKNTSFWKSPEPENPYEWIGNLKIVNIAQEYQIDRYSMIIKNGNSESIAEWGKKIELIKGEWVSPVVSFTVHDIQAKDDRIAILFSEKEVFLEVICPDSAGVYKVLFSKSLAKQSGSVPYFSSIKKGGQLMWLDNALYVMANTLMEDTEFWELKNAKAKSDVFDGISGPFFFYRIIKDKEKNSAETD